MDLADQEGQQPLSDNTDDQENVELQSYIDELNEKIKQKTDLRSKNLSCIRPVEEYFSKLDSNLKKNTAFVKKLKQFTATQLPALQKDISGMNLTKYISEISSSLVEAKLKMTDIGAAVLLCSDLHQLYVEFAPTFFENWQKVLSLKPNDRILNASKMRVDLRFYAELISVGIFSNKVGLPLLGSILTSLISQGSEDHSNLSIILSFCRHCGEEYAGLVNKRISELSQKQNIQLPTSHLLPADKQQNLRNLLRDYYNGLIKHLQIEHRKLQEATKVGRRIMESKGEVSTERKEKLDLMQSNFDKLYQSTIQMADLLNETVPDLPKDEESTSTGMILNMTDDSTDVILDPWGDDETKCFYCDLPDLHVFLPNYAPKQVDILPEEPPITEEVLDMDIEPEQLVVDETEELREEFSKSETPEPQVDDQSTSTTTIGGKTTSTKQQFDNFLQQLVNCVNKELIDSAAIDFLLNLNTRNNRKKLARNLYSVQRTRLDLLPFYARLVATINLVSQDVAIDLVQLLRNEFKWHIKQKNQMKIESKIKVVRFIGEMCKFNLYPKLETLFCLKVLLHDFQHHQIEMICALLEVVGQYLFNCKDTRFRTNVYLEQMLRLKTVMSLDSRHAAQVENAYYLVKPPEGTKTIQKVRSPLQQYIRHLIYEELNKSNVDKIIKSIRRLNWNDNECSDYAVKCLSKAYNIRYHLIRCLADLLSGISSYQDKVVVRVIDTVLEDIRAGLEIHSPKLAQRRIAMAKYLGELYNYRLVESTIILNTLYSIISLGVSMDHSIMSELDPPGSLFRLKLACVLLDTSGQYMTSAISRKKLDYFLEFFQQYYWYKKSDPVFSIGATDTTDLFPILVDHMYRECLNNIRPKLKQYKSFAAAKEAVEKLRLKLYPNLYRESNDDNDNEMATISEDLETEDGNDLTEDTSEAVPDSDGEDGKRKGLLNEDDNNRNSSPNDLEINQDIEPNVHEPTAEDIEFEQAFEKMALDSYQERLKEQVKPNTKDIPVPMMGRSGKKTYDQLQKQPVVQLPTDASADETTVPFVLMIRGGKGSKQQFKTFVASSNSELAINLRLHEQKTREENERVKRLTLNITERLEEEDYQESLLQSQRSPTINRNSKQSKPCKYKHQKGAPDADTIFR